MRRIGKNLACAVVASCALVTLCCGSGPTGGANDASLVLALPPGRIADFNRVIGPGFTERTGITFELVGLRSAEQVARVRIERDHPSFDILWIDASDALVLAKEDLLAKVSVSEIPSLTKVRPEAMNPMGIPPVTFASAIGFLYNTERLPSPPRSWAALWDPQWRGELAWFDFGSNLGPLSLVMAARINGGSEKDIEVGFRRLTELLPNIAQFGTSGPANNNLVAQGEAGLTLGLAHHVRDLRAGGAPVESIVPEEGAIALPQGFQIVAATSRQTQAREFLEYTLSTEAQTRFANELFLVTSNTEVQVDASLESLVPLGQTLYFDFESIGAQRGVWTNRFNREVLSQR